MAAPFHRAPPGQSRPNCVIIGHSGPCTQPYSASVLNISAMSYGALSANAVRALNWGAKRGGYAHDTGEGGVSPCHHEAGGDLIREIGSGCFGCRRPDGSCNPDQFAKAASDPQIKMVGLKLSQGAKPGHGGVLPAAKVTAEIAAIRGVPMGEDCVSPRRAFRLCDPGRTDAVHCPDARAFGRQTRRVQAVRRPPLGGYGAVQGDAGLRDYPRLIVVDDKECGTGAAPLEFMDHRACRCAMA